MWGCLSLAVAAAAQPPGGRAAPPEPPARGGRTLRQNAPSRAATGDVNANAGETQRRLGEILQQYPPSLGQVLALDPTLLSNASYLEPYPALAEFLEQHPEIAHNPGFFLAGFRENNRRQYDYNDPRVAALRTVDNAFGYGTGIIIFLAIVVTIAWIIRTVIEQRKWQRMTATHVETHTKLMDRLTSNEDLLAYMQSPAGRRFLEAAPIPLDAGPKSLGAPFGRILWSVQAGLVVAFLGAGLIFASHRLAGTELFADGEIPLFVLGAAAIAVGAGFFVSAIAAYGLSHRLGLFPARPSSDIGGANHTS